MENKNILVIAEALTQIPVQIASLVGGQESGLPEESVRRRGMCWCVLSRISRARWEETKG